MYKEIVMTDRKLWESISKAVDVAEGNVIYEASTGRTTASVSIAKEWLSALKDIVANKADALKVQADFEKRIDAEVAKGDYSSIYSQIRQQMPDIMDLGLVAANIESIEKWLRQDTTRSMAEEKESANEAMGDNMSFTTAVEKPSKVNSSGDTPDIPKSGVQVKDPEALDVINSNGGTQGDEIVEGYYVDKDDNIFYVHEDGNAFYVDEEGTPIEEGFLGNVFDIEIACEKLEVYEDDSGDSDTVEPYELFEDSDGDVVYFNEDGDLYYATDEEIEEALQNEDVNIYYNNDGQGGINMEQEGGGEMPPQSPQMPPEDPNAQAQAQAAAQSPQEPMQVELINNGESGEVSGVVVDVAGKRIQIGPDGTVDEQPSGGNTASPQQGPPPQNNVAQEEYNMSVASNILKFFGEDNQDYTDVKKKTPKTAIGGDFPDGLDPVDSTAVDAMNSGGDIDGHKAIAEDTVEPYELFEEKDGSWWYYDESGSLFEATEEQVQEAKSEVGPKNHDDVTIPLGIGKSITSVNEEAPANEEVIGISNRALFLNMVNGIRESWKSLEDIDQEYGVQPNKN